MRTTSQSESTRVPPVTARAVAAALPDDGGALARDGAFVHRGDPLDHLAVAGDELAGLHQHHVALREGRAEDTVSEDAPR